MSQKYNIDSALQRDLSISKGRVSVSSNHSSQPKQHTSSPSVSGTAVIGLAFQGGVVLAADSVASYGSLCKLRTVPRLLKVNNNTVVAVTGDYADYQFIEQHIAKKSIADFCSDDGYEWSPKSLHSWLTRVLYNSRSKLDPMWNSYVVGGLEEGESYVGGLTMLGISYNAPYIATGFGRFIAQPFLADQLEKNPALDEKTAREVAVHALRLLYYRNRESSNKYQLAVVTKDGAVVDPVKEFEGQWNTALMIRGYE
ncbi:proteasome subunit beta type-4-like [Paramacrobiotus metropolitanus]|uniref:proteasome subunit beta type-4-like n=1 Tax=Paramacrobiotus metropolitanus TaxID=2943436 RepID=UPI002445B568|nr:proteasome subunit beta type-4-like [Paramacrobiotus metropolitanus]